MKHAKWPQNSFLQRQNDFDTAATLLMQKTKNSANNWIQLNCIWKRGAFCGLNKAKINPLNNATNNNQTAKKNSIRWDFNARRMLHRPIHLIYFERNRLEWTRCMRLNGIFLILFGSYCWFGAHTLHCTIAFVSLWVEITYNSCSMFKSQLNRDISKDGIKYSLAVK